MQLLFDIGWVVCHEQLSILNINPSTIIFPHEWYIKHAGFTTSQTRVCRNEDKAFLVFFHWFESQKVGKQKWGCFVRVSIVVFFISHSVYRLYRGNKRFLIHFQAPHCRPRSQMGDCLVCRQQETQELFLQVGFYLPAFIFSYTWVYSSVFWWFCTFVHFTWLSTLSSFSLCVCEQTWRPRAAPGP